MRKGAVLASGTILTRGTPVFDLVNGTVLRATGDLPLIVPENAVVVPGSRAVTRGKGQEWGLSLRAGHRQVPRRQDQPQHHARRPPPLVFLPHTWPFVFFEKGTTAVVPPRAASNLGL